MCGRDSRVERNEIIVLFVRTCSERILDDKADLRHWLKACHAKHVQPTEGVVKIYALQESSSDWVPEWAFERVKPCWLQVQPELAERDAARRLCGGLQIQYTLNPCWLHIFKEEAPGLYADIENAYTAKGEGTSIQAEPIGLSFLFSSGKKVKIKRWVVTDEEKKNILQSILATLFIISIIIFMNRSVLRNRIV